MLQSMRHGSQSRRRRRVEEFGDSDQPRITRITRIESASAVPICFLIAFFILPYVTPRPQAHQQLPLFVKFRFATWWATQMLCNGAQTFELEEKPPCGVLAWLFFFRCTSSPLLWPPLTLRCRSCLSRIWDRRILRFNSPQEPTPTTFF